MSRSPYRACLSLCLLVGVVALGVVLASTGVAASPLADDDSAVATITGGNDNASANTTTPPHENPATVSESGNPDQVAGYLSSQLSGLLGDSTLNLSEGQYDQARAVLGDDYNETLQQYVEVSGDADSDTVESLRTARNNTRSLIELREEFEQTRSEYEAAVAAGNTSRARRFARELTRLAEQIDSISVQLTDEYADIENATGQELEGQETIRLVQETTAEEAQAATTAQLRRTRLQAELNTTRFSFYNPAQLTGQLQTANGTPIRNESVTITVGSRVHTVSTSNAGTFSLTYRPVSASLTTSAFPVSYLPADDSVYLESNATVTGSIMRQTPTTVSVEVPNRTIEYGTPFLVTGRAYAGENTSLGDVPIVATVAGQQVGTTTTAPNGSFSFDGRLQSPIIASGSQQLRASLPFRNQSLVGSTTTVPVEITPAPTQLTVNTTPPESTTASVTVNGALRLQTGEPLAGQQIDIFVNGTRIGSVQTTATGQYETTLQQSIVDLPPNATISVQFDGGDTALGPSRASAVLTLPTSASAQSSLIAMITAQPALVGGGTILAVVSAGLLIVSLRRESSWLSGEDTVTSPAAQTSSADVYNSQTNSPPSQAQTLLTAAEDALASGDATKAVQIAYSGLRSALADDVAVTGDETHWEFYQKCQSGDVNSLSTVYEITTAYELATFASEPISTQAAEETVTAVSTLVDSEG